MLGWENEKNDPVSRPDQDQSQNLIDSCLGHILRLPTKFHENRPSFETLPSSLVEIMRLLLEVFREYLILSMLVHSHCTHLLKVYICSALVKVVVPDA